MPDGTDVTYRYDGTFDGLMCCVFESFERREIPRAVIAPGEEQLSLFESREIETDAVRANRVKDAMPVKIGADALDFVQRAFLTCLEEKERRIILFLHKGFRYGGRVMDMIADDMVDRLAKAVRHLGNEAHLLSGFIRFSIYGDVMAAVITPKNFVLPLLAPHFAGRYPGENFLIYDKTHEAALIHENGNMRVCNVKHFVMPAPDEEELRFRRMWRMFYDTIAVEGRYNPKCRMSHMPKRYWENMTEFARAGSRGGGRGADVARVAAEGAKMKEL
jgi:probable DNA metabolism protein